MNNIMRRGALMILAVFALALAPVSAGAQELAPEHLALARKYVDLTDKSGVYEIALITAGVETLRTILPQNPEISDPLDAAIKTTLEGYKDRKGELMDQFARLYALRFSVEELQQIVTFYEFPVGLKLATANANMTEDMRVVMRVFESNLKKEFFAKVRAELKAAGFNV